MKTDELQKKNGIMFSSFRPCFLEKTPETDYGLSKIFYSVSDTGDSEKNSEFSQWESNL